MFFSSYLLIIVSSLPALLVDGFIIQFSEYGGSECYFEYATKGDDVGVEFEVIDGEPMAIDFVVLDPYNQVLFRDPNNNFGEHIFQAKTDGKHQICFRSMNSKSPKFVMFDFGVLDTEKPGPNQDTETKEQIDQEVAKFESMIKKLLKSVYSNRHGARHLIARDKVHKRVNMKTNSSIVWWSVVEFLLIMGVAIGQVWYLRRFFEIQRKA